VGIIEIRAEQLQQIGAIAITYKNLECVECAQAIKNYLINQGIHGKHIKLYTGAGIGRNSYIYDDSVPGDAISINGRHQAIAIVINEVEMVFDNHHPYGIPKEEWIENLQFYGKTHYYQQFDITEEYF
jgi:hypothetical protein